MIRRWWKQGAVVSALALALHFGASIVEGLIEDEIEGEIECGLSAP